MKKKKKKQEPIFSALEEIRIEKTEKNFFEPATIAVVPPEPSQPILSPTGIFLPSEPEAISPENETSEGITIPRLSEPAAVRSLETPAETVTSRGGCLPDEQEIIGPTTAASLPDFSFVFISPGSFIMGSPETELGRSDDELPHEVSIAHGFFIQTTPITQGQWKAVMGTNPSRFSSQGDDHPVESVSWYDCQKFIEVLNSIGEHRYRLPTEAEWEYACRSGKFSSCSGGEIIELFCDHDPNLDAAGWYCGNSSRATHPVARKKPNPWGLYDVHGNVLEWCQDCYGTYPATPQTDPSGPITGPGRVIRGGSWFSNAKSCRAASRFYWSPNAKSDFIGFRLVREK